MSTVELDSKTYVYNGVLRSRRILKHIAREYNFYVKYLELTILKYKFAWKINPDLDLIKRIIVLSMLPLILPIYN